MAAFIVGEGNWLPIAMLAAVAASAVFYLRSPALTDRGRIMGMMNLLVGVLLAFMGIGHLLAVSVKAADGSLRGDPLLLMLIGAAIVTPAIFIIRVTGRLAADGGRRTAVRLHGWMAATLVLLGLINLPLAMPAALCIAYARHTRRATGIAIVSAYALVNAALLIGGLMFMLSGAQTFEEFSNMQ